MQALGSLGQPDLFARDFDREDGYLGAIRSAFFECFRQKRSVVRGGDDGRSESSRGEELGQVNGGNEMALSHEREEEYVKLVMGFV